MATDYKKWDNLAAALSESDDNSSSEEEIEEFETAESSKLNASKPKVNNNDPVGTTIPGLPNVTRLDNRSKVTFGGGSKQVLVEEGGQGTQQKTSTATSSSPKPVSTAAPSTPAVGTSASAKTLLTDSTESQGSGQSKRETQIKEKIEKWTTNGGVVCA